jgi:antitoxin (DNA-binding transcriptional repressor) of toxin-antitoxin stability system
MTTSGSEIVTFGTYGYGIDVLVVRVHGPWLREDFVHCCTLTYNDGMAVMTVSEARAALPEVLNRVADGEEVTITRHGRPVAVIVRPDVMWSRSRAEVVLAESAHLGKMLDAAARSPLPDAGGISERYAEELITSIRADRDRL